MAQLDHVARKIIECFQDAGLDASYIESKRIELKECKNKYESLVFASMLDQANTERLAKKLDCSARELTNVIRFIKYHI